MTASSLSRVSHNSRINNRLVMLLRLKDEKRQKESGRRLFLLASLGAVAAGSARLPAHADGGLDAGGLTFKDFGTADNGASFNRSDPMLAGRPEPAAARL